MSETGAGPGSAIEAGSARPVAPPAWLLTVAGGTVVTAGVLVFLRIVTVHWIGYLLSAFVAVALVARFRSVDHRRRENPFYTPVPALRATATGLLLVSYLVAAAHAWLLATHYA